MNKALADCGENLLRCMANKRLHESNINSTTNERRDFLENGCHFCTVIGFRAIGSGFESMVSKN
jgi:hypothetical protein